VRESAFAAIVEEFFNEIGHKQTFEVASVMSALPPKADMLGGEIDVS
jgi:hypothetical protein